MLLYQERFNPLRIHTRSIRLFAPGSLPTLLTAALVGVGITADANQQFDVTVHLVRIEVAVTDRQREPVRGLSADDFRVTADEHELQIAGIVETDHGARLETRRSVGAAGGARIEPGEITGDEVLSQTRSFLILVDLTHMGARGLRYTRQAASKFVAQGLSPSDQVAVAVYSPRRGLELAVPFSGDHGHAERWLAEFSTARAVERLEPIGDGIDLIAFGELDFGEVAEWIEQVDGVQLAMGAQDLLSSLAAVTQTLASVPGSKHVLFFSRGLPDLALADSGFRMELTATTRIAEERGVAIHTLDPSVLPGWDYHDVRRMQSSYRTAQESGRGDPASLTDLAGPSAMPNRAVLNFLSSETGGSSTYFRHALDKGLSAIADSSRHRYLIALRLDRDLNVQNRELTVALRTEREAAVEWWPRRLALPEDPEAHVNGETAGLSTSSALQFGRDVEDLEVRFSAEPRNWSSRGGTLAIVLEVPYEELDRVSRIDGVDRLEFEILGFAVAEDRTVQDHFRGRVGLADFTRLRGKHEALRYTNALGTGTGEHYIKLLVRESESGLLASKSIRFVVPEEPSSELRGSPVALIASTAPVVDGATRGTQRASSTAEAEYGPYSFGGTSLAPLVEARVVAGEELTALIDVYNATPHPFTGAPSVGVRAEVVTDQGTVPIVLTAVSAESRESPADLRLLVQGKWPDELPSTCKSLSLTIEDRIAAATATSSRPITCLPGR